MKFETYCAGCGKYLSPHLAVPMKLSYHTEVFGTQAHSDGHEN
jgi:hypothetical protein